MDFLKYFSIFVNFGKKLPFSVEKFSKPGLEIHYRNGKLNNKDGKFAFYQVIGKTVIEASFKEDKLFSNSPYEPSIRVTINKKIRILYYFKNDKIVSFIDGPGIVVEEKNNYECFFFNEREQLVIQKNTFNNTFINYVNDEIDQRKINIINGEIFSSIKKLIKNIDEIFLSIYIEDIHNNILTVEQIKDRDDNFIEHTLSFLFKDENKKEKSEFLLDPLKSISEEIEKSKYLYEIKKNQINTIKKNKVKCTCFECVNLEKVILNNLAKKRSYSPRCAPDISAKNFDIGDVVKGLDGKNWTVIKNLKGFLKWCKK